MVPDDMAMMVEDPIAETVGGWDTKKWREDFQIANSKLQHSSHFNPGKSGLEHIVLVLGRDTVLLTSCSQVPRPYEQAAGNKSS